LISFDWFIGGERMKRNFYDFFGIPRDAGERQIKAAYRRLIKSYHPDLHPNDRRADELLKAANEAAETLLDPQKRKEYDDSLWPQTVAHSGKYAGEYAGGDSFQLGGIGASTLIFATSAGIDGWLEDIKRKGRRRKALRWLAGIGLFDYIKDLTEKRRREKRKD